MWFNVLPRAPGSPYLEGGEKSSMAGHQILAEDGVRDGNWRATEMYREIATTKKLHTHTRNGETHSNVMLTTCDHKIRSM